MKRGRLAAAFLAVLSAAAYADDPTKLDPAAAALKKARAIEQQLVTTVETVCQSSVSVLNLRSREATPERPAGPPTLAGVGSGVLVTRNGKTWILTNQHVVDKADKLQVVTRDGVKRTVDFVDSVKRFDIALLRFSDGRTAAAAGLKPVPVVGKKATELDEGQWCIATGNPFFLAMDGAPVVTLGVISGLDRVLGDKELTYGRAIQHDAAVNPGNSGGPLWTLKGDFVGINGMINYVGSVAGQGASNMGAAFSIPADEVDVFLGQLIDDKKNACEGKLGLLFETDTDKNGKPVGARVVAPEPHCPSPSGIAPGDVVTALTIESGPTSGKRFDIRTETDVFNALSLCPAGTKIGISYRRGSSPGRCSFQLQ